MELSAPQKNLFMVTIQCPESQASRPELIFLEIVMCNYFQNGNIIIKSEAQKDKISDTVFISSDVESGKEDQQIECHDITKIVMQNGLEQSSNKIESLSGDCAALRSLKSKDKEEVISVLCGKFTDLVHRQARIVRIFTSSTFTDTFVERNYLMHHVYPKIKKYCQEHGFEFQVVDMRWGVRHEAMDDHQVLHLCIKEIENCQKVSTGPYFLTLLSEKYGYRPLPAQINEEEFLSLVAKLQTAEDVEFLHSWYKLDDNNRPRIYVLQPISSRIPDYVNTTNEERRKQGIIEWSAASKSLAKILRLAADEVLLANDKRKYFASVTEIEIDQGIMQPACDRRNCFWFKRSIANLPLVKDDVVAQYRDCGDSDNDNNDDDDFKQKAVFLSNIHTRILNKLDAVNVKEYNIEWDNEGVNPDNREHASYLSQLCTDVYGALTKRIDEAIEERARNEVNLAIYEEVCQHVEFAKSRCEYFHGRGEELNEIHNYLKGSVNHPLVVHGESGSGKTSVLSMALECSRSWFASDVAVIARYLGTTPDSSLLRRLLYSICQQIAILLNQDYDAANRKVLKTLKDDFTNFLASCKSKFSAERPLILILDSLDQLSPEDGAFQLTWLPTVLPPWVKMIISTLSADKYDCLKKIQCLLPAQCFVTISRLPLSDAVYIVDRWLLKNQRLLTHEQRRMLLAAFEKCSLPIFLKVSLEKALRWKSYTKPDEIILESTVRGAISSLFERIERQHGRVFVRHALSYITVSKNGLTESELEDVLSCDEQVLEDVYQYWVPPVRRIPPLLWLRLKHDLSSYLADRGADESMVVTWYHRQFVETARERFLSDENERIRTHRALADYFMGVWADGNKKPYKSKDGSMCFSERLVASQPVMFKTDHQCSYEGQQFNLRKLSELPYHLVMSADLEVLKRECLCNYEFLLTQLRARGLSEVMDNFTLALAKWPTDKDLTTVHETLQLSTNALSLWPGQLASQLMSRIQRQSIKNSQCLKLLENMAKKPSLPALVPQICCLTSPGGPLLQSLSGSSEKPTALRLSPDGRTLISIGEDTEMLIWDVLAGRVIRNIDCPGGGSTYSCLSKDGSTLVISKTGLIKSWSTLTGQLLFSMDDHDEAAPISICTVNLNEALVCYIGETLKILDLQSGKILTEYHTKLTQKQCDRPLKHMLTSWKTKCIVTHKDMFSKSSSQDNSTIIEALDANVKHSHKVFQVKSINDIMSIEIIVQDQLLVTYAGIEEDLNKNRRPSARPSVATSWQKMSLEIWDMATMMPTGQLTSQEEMVRCSCVAPDRRKIIMLCNSSFVESACEFKAAIKIYSVVEKESLKLSLNYPSSVIAICGIRLNCIITSSLDKIIRVWDLERSLDTAERLKEIYGRSDDDSAADLSNEVLELLESPRAAGENSSVKFRVGHGETNSRETVEEARPGNGIHDAGPTRNGNEACEETPQASNSQRASDNSVANSLHDSTATSSNLASNNVFHLQDDSIREEMPEQRLRLPSEGSSGIGLCPGSPANQIKRPSLPVGKNYMKLSFHDISKAVDPILQDADGVDVEDIQVESCLGNIVVFYARRLTDCVHAAIIWNLDSDLRLRISGLHNPEACIAGGEDGSPLLVVLSSSTLSIYRACNGDLLRSVNVNVNCEASNRLVFLGDDKAAVIDNGRRMAKIYSIPSLENIKTITVGAKETIMRIVPSQNGAHFVNCLHSAKIGKTIQSVVEIWQTQGFSKLHTFEYQNLLSEFSDTQLFNNGTLLADMAYDTKDQQYQLITYSTVTLKITYITPPGFSVNIFKLSSDNKSVIIGTWTGDVLSYEIPDDTQSICTIKHVAKAHSGPVHQILVSQTADQVLTIAGAFNSRDRSVRLWRMRNGHMITEYTPDVKISSMLATKDFRFVVFEIQGKLVKFELLHGVE
eukprot:gene12962-14292_t